MADLIVGIISLIALICFFVLCSTAGKILFYLRRTYLLLKLDAVERGLISPDDNVPVKWKYDLEADKIVTRK